MANQRLTNISIVLLFSAVLLASSGCIIKTKVSVPIPKNIGQDKTATFEELMDIARRNDKIETLTSSRLHVTLTEGKLGSGVLVKYRTGSGYILLKRPDALLLNIKHPVASSSIFELLSQGDEFKVWDAQITSCIRERTAQVCWYPQILQMASNSIFPAGRRTFSARYCRRA